VDFLTAPTSLGNRPYEQDGSARLTTLGPSRLRETGLVQRLRARDLGDVPAADYRDFVRPHRGVRNEDLILAHTHSIARALEPHNDFTVIVGGDCSVLLGSLLGLRRGREIGLVYLDAHSDFGTEETSETGGVAGMVLAQVVGRGRSPLARLLGNTPLVAEENVVAIGVRETGSDFDNSRIQSAHSAEETLAALGDRDFFIHVDADVLDPSFMPFVDSPTGGGLSPEELLAILRPLARHPRAIGLELTIYDPREDHDGRGAALLADLVLRVLRVSA
jgi:arginase